MAGTALFQSGIHKQSFNARPRLTHPNLPTYTNIIGPVSTPTSYHSHHPPSYKGPFTKKSLPKIGANISSAMQSHPPPPAGPAPPPPPTSFLSLPYELRHQIYRLALRALPRVKPMRCRTAAVPIYCLQHLDPRPLLLAHPQVRHEVQALLASHRTRIQIPSRDGESALSAPTREWLLRSGGIEFERVRVWSELPLPIILDVDVLVDDAGLVTVQHRWRWRPSRWRLYSWGRYMIRPAWPVMLEYLVEGLRKRLGARGGAGVGIGEVDFLMEGMGRFRSWIAMHQLLLSWNARLPAESYEEKIAGLRWKGDEDKEDFRRQMRWWDGVEAEVRDLKTSESRVLL